MIRKNSGQLAVAVITFSTLLPFLQILPSYSIQAICMLGAALYLALPVISSWKMTKSSVYLGIFFVLWLLFSICGFSLSRVSTYVALVWFMTWAMAAPMIADSETYPEKMIKITGILSAVFTIYFMVEKDVYAEFAKQVYPANMKRLISDNNVGNIPGLYNHYSKNGMVLSVSTGIFFISFLQKKRMGGKALQLGSLVLCAGALLLTGKRGPIIFSLLAMGMCYVLFLGKKWTSRKVAKIIFPVGAIIVGYVILVSYVPQLGRFIERFYETAKRGTITTGREVFYEQAIDMFLSKPLLGHGWYSFAKTSARAQNAHNIYLQLLAETGIVGFCVFVGAFVYIIWITLKEYRLAQFAGDQVAGGQLLKALYLLFLFVMYGMTGNPLYDTLMLCPFFMAISIMRFYHERRMKQSVA